MNPAGDAAGDGDPCEDSGTSGEGFEEQLTESRIVEAQLPWRQLLALAVVVGVVALRAVWFA